MAWAYKSESQDLSDGGAQGEDLHDGLRAA